MEEKLSTSTSNLLQNQAQGSDISLRTGGTAVDNNAGGRPDSGRKSGDQAAGEEIAFTTADDIGGQVVDGGGTVGRRKRKGGIVEATLKMGWQVVLFTAALARADLFSFGLLSVSIVHKCAYLLPTRNLRGPLVRVALWISVVSLLTRILFHAVIAATGDYPSYLPSTAERLFGLFPIDTIAEGFQSFLPEIIVFVYALILLWLQVFVQNDHARENRRRIAGAAFLAAFLLLFWKFFVLVSASFSPNALSIIYTLYAVLEVVFWASAVDLSEFVGFLRAGYLVVNLVHCLVLHIFQIDIIRESAPENVTNVLGLYDYSDPASTVPEVLYIAAVFASAITLATHGSISVKYKLSRNKIPFTANLGIVKTFFSRRAPSANGLLARMSDYILRNGSRVSAILTFILALTFPSLITLPILLWSCVIIVTPNDVFLRTSFYVLVYFGMFCFIQGLWNIHDGGFPRVPDAGLVEHDPVWAYISLQLILFYSFALICFPWDASDVSTASLTDSVVSRAQTIDELSPSEVPRLRKSWFDWKTTKEILSFMWGNVSAFILTYAYLISLVVLYICGLQDVNIINTVFLIYFLSFLIFPNLARRAWRSLVVYTEFVIVLQFLWQFSWFQDADVQNARLFGLQYEGTLWYQLRFHVVILVFTVLQLNTYEILDAQDQRRFLLGHWSGVEEQEQIPEYIKTHWIRRLAVGLSRTGETLIQKYTFVGCYLVFSLICILKPATIFDIGYLAIFFFCLLCHQFKSPGIIRRFWLWICLYAGSILALAYTYQFVEIHSYFIDRFGEQALNDMGLIVQTGSDLFRYLFQHIFALFLCVLQFRIYQSNVPRKKFFGDGGAFAPHVASKLLPIVRFFQRFCVIHLTKIIYLLTFLTAVQYPSVIGFGLMLYAVLVIPFPKTQRHTRAGMMILVQIVILSQLIYQLQTVQQQVSNVEDAAYFGFIVFDATLPPVTYMGVNLVLLYALALQLGASVWKVTIRTKHPEYPEEESHWPLFDTQDTLTAISPTTMMRHASIPEQSFWTALNYWGSNFYRHFGFEITIFVHSIVAFAKLDAFGLLYFACAGVFLVSPLRQVAAAWAGYLGFISVCAVFQYASAIGLPPFTGESYPWASLDSTLLDLLGVPVKADQLYLVPDFFLLLFCSFQWTVFLHPIDEISGFEEWRQYRVLLDIDFTVKPRSKLNQIKFLFVRYFIWLPAILLYAEGTSNINLPGFIYLCFALYIISIGESAIMESKARGRVWNFVMVYTYVWLAVQLIYQFPAYLIPIEDSGFDTSFGAQMRILFGLRRLNPSPAAENPAVVQLIVQFLVFLAILGQRRLNGSNSLFYVMRYVKEDIDLAFMRAVDYRINHKREINEQKETYDREVKQLQEKVAQLKKVEYGVEDWIKFYGRRADEYGYAIVDPVVEETGERTFDVTSIDEEDPLIVFRHDRITAERHFARSSSLELEEIDEASVSTLRRRKTVSSKTETSPETEGTYDTKALPPESVSEEASKMSEERAVLPESKGKAKESDDKLHPEEIDRQERARLLMINRRWYNKMIDGVTDWLYKSSTDYSDVYIPKEELEKARERNRSNRIWGFFRSLFFAIFAHTALICYVAIFANQIYHGNILSTIPTVTVLIIGFTQRPYPGRRFWQFIIFFMEFTIFLKFFFQFDIWEFNNLQCPVPEDFGSSIYILGIEKTCGPFPTEVITELAVLLTCIFHRGLLIRLGLWKYFRELDAQENKRAASQGQIPISPTFGSNPDSSLEDIVIGWRISMATTYDEQKRYVVRVVRDFFDQSKLPGIDYYLGYFVADFLVFLLTIMFWTSFSGDASSTSVEFLDSVLNQNIVPPLFVAIIVTNFCLIIVDRAIYTSKSLIAKFILHVLTVLVFTYWLFFILPASNNEKFKTMPTLQIWYFTKCVYWYFSGLQIKAGFPRLRIYNFLMRNYGIMNRIAFIVFRSIPFVWEFRTLTDWAITPSTLNVYNWLKFEDAFASLYIVKSVREFEKNIPRRFGEQPKVIWKRLSGCLMVVGLVFLIWFPLILMSLPTNSEQNPTAQMDVQIQITGFEPFYRQSLPEQFISNYTDEQYEELRTEYPELFSSYYAPGLVEEVRFQRNSMALWQITPPAREVLAVALSNSSLVDLTLLTSWSLQKEGPGVSQTARGSSVTYLTASVQAQLQNAINSTDPGTYEIDVPKVYPRFLRATTTGTVANLGAEGYMLVDCRLRYQIAEEQSNGTTISWWSVVTYDEDGTESNPIFTVLSDNVAAFGILTSYGVIGLYVVVVLAAGRYIRLFISDLTSKIPYEDLPNPDAIVQLCFDIFLAREFGDFETEETLFWQLISIYRQPALMMEKTRVENYRPYD